MKLNAMWNALILHPSKKVEKTIGVRTTALKEEKQGGTLLLSSRV